MASPWVGPPGSLKATMGIARNRSQNNCKGGQWLVVVCDGDSSGQMVSPGPLGCGQGTAWVSEQSCTGGAFTVTWRSLQGHLGGGTLSAIVGSVLGVWGKTAARLVQVSEILQNTGCSEKLCVRQREGVEDPVSLGAREPSFSSRTCQQLVGDFG